MTSETKYLRQRDGRWLVQVAVPKDIRDRVGRPNIEKWLHTDSVAEAKRLRHGVVAQILEFFERVRKRKPLTDSEIDKVSKEEIAKFYAFLDDNLSDGYGNLGDWLFSVTDSDGPDYRYLRPHAVEIIERIGAEPTEETIKKVSDKILDAGFTAQELWSRNIAPPQVGPAARRKIGTGPTITDVAETYIKEITRDPKTRPTNQTIAQMWTSFRLFGDHTANARLDVVTRQDAANFLDTIGGLDPNYGRSPKAKGLALRDLLLNFPAKDGKGLSNTTLNRHASALRGLYKWARKRGLYDGENPFAEQSRKKPTLSETTYLHYELDELQKLVEAPSTEPKKHNLASARPWVVWIALYSGMRLGEICELAVEDIREQDGIPYFDITEAKSEAGVRRVPIHSELIKLGLLDYVKSIGSGDLFPGVTRGGPDKKRGHTFSKRFAPWRVDQGVDRNRVSFHSFRKNTVRALENAQIDRDLAAQVVGHERGFTYHVYNPEGVDMKLLKDVIEKITYDGLRLG